MGLVFGRIKEETPKTMVLLRTKEFEIRKYPEMVEAYATNDSRDGAFWILASYIGVLTTPKNQSKEPIAMTAPVRMQPERIAMTAPVKMDQNTMAFILPSKYTIDTTPKPLDERVHLRVVPPQILAVKTFSGNYWLNNCEGKVRELREALDREGIEIVDDDWSFLAYNSPYTLRWFRTNEVAFPVKYDDNQE